MEEKGDADEEEEKRTFNSSYEIIVDYSEYSTIQGFIYIFFSYQTIFGKIFWIIVILGMLALGLYWCIQAYLDWQDKPVLTTITTTAYSVKQVRNATYDSREMFGSKRWHVGQNLYLLNGIKNKGCGPQQYLY